MKNDNTKKSVFGRKGFIIPIIVIVAAVVVLFALRRAKEEPITIGAILSLSGPGGVYGEDARDGLLLAVECACVRGENVDGTVVQGPPQRLLIFRLPDRWARCEVMSVISLE